MTATVTDRERPSPRRPSLVRRVATIAAVLLVSMGAQGGPGPRLAPRSATLRTLEPAQASPAAPSTAAAAAFDPADVSLSLTLVAGGFDEPVLVTGAGDGSGRLFVVEQTGRVWVIAGGKRLATPFLDLSGSISTGGERGLLGLAFHPSFPAKPYVYVDFTDGAGDTRVNRYSVGSNPNRVTSGSGVRLLTIDQPYPNHNGGNLAFGPDGFLYIGMGDGGSAGDPGGRAQDVATLLGKLLRIDVDHTSSGKRYAIPATNPYVGRLGLDEIWAKGLRNPWRWSFDRATGDLWIGDVGQSRYEEIDRVIKPATESAGRGANFGWNVVEGRACFEPASRCSTRRMEKPLVVYGHSVAGADNCSVTGGFVSRGAADPVLAGGYVFGDYCSGRIWVVASSSPAPATPTVLRDATASPQLSISSFGEGDAGELYVVDRGGGRIYRIRAVPRG